MKVNTFITDPNGYVGQVKSNDGEEIVYLNEENQMFFTAVSDCVVAKRPSYWNADLDSCKIID